MPRSVNSMGHEEFSKLFMAAVIEFYEEWKADNDASIPDFEEAIERAKEQGVAQEADWPAD